MTASSAFCYLCVLGLCLAHGHLLENRRAYWSMLTCEIVLCRGAVGTADGGSATVRPLGKTAAARGAQRGARLTGIGEAAQPAGLPSSQATNAEQNAGKGAPRKLSEGALLTAKQMGRDRTGAEGRSGLHRQNSEHGSYSGPDVLNAVSARRQ